MKINVFRFNTKYTLRVDRLARAASDLGVERAIMRLPVQAEAQVLASLDRYAEMAARV